MGIGGMGFNVKAHGCPSLSFHVHRRAVLTHAPVLRDQRFHNGVPRGSTRSTRAGGGRDSERQRGGTWTLERSMGRGGAGRDARDDDGLFEYREKLLLRSHRVEALEAVGRRPHHRCSRFGTYGGACSEGCLRGHARSSHGHDGHLGRVAFEIIEVGLPHKGVKLVLGKVEQMQHRCQQQK